MRAKFASCATKTAEQAKRFEAANPGTKVVIDTVPYKSIVEQLPVQLAAGQGPDIARVTDLGGLSKYYLDISAHVKDRKYWDTNFGATAGWLRPSASDKGIYGFMSQLTMTGPYVNKTLFEQAKVPMPGAKATWDEWVEASRKVAKATETKDTGSPARPSATVPKCLTHKAMRSLTMGTKPLSQSSSAGTKMAAC